MSLSISARSCAILAVSAELVCWTGWFRRAPRALLPKPVSSSSGSWAACWAWIWESSALSSSTRAVIPASISSARASARAVRSLR